MRSNQVGVELYSFWIFYILYTHIYWWNHWNLYNKLLSKVSQISNYNVSSGIKLKLPLLIIVNGWPLGADSIRRTYHGKSINSRAAFGRKIWTPLINSIFTVVTWTMAKFVVFQWQGLWGNSCQSVNNKIIKYYSTLK